MQMVAVREALPVPFRVLVSLSRQVLFHHLMIDLVVMSWESIARFSIVRGIGQLRLVGVACTTASTSGASQAHVIIKFRTRLLRKHLGPCLTQQNMRSKAATSWRFGAWRLDAN